MTMFSLTEILETLIQVEGNNLENIISISYIYMYKKNLNILTDIGRDIVIEINFFTSIFLALYAMHVDLMITPIPHVFFNYID